MVSTKAVVHPAYCTKRVLEDVFGKMSDDMYYSILSTVQNEYQQVAVHNVFPDRENFINSLALIVEFHRKRLDYLN